MKLPIAIDEDEEICDMEVTGNGIVIGCLVYGGHLATARMQTFRAPNNIETEDEYALQCQIREKRFSRATNLRRHVCTGVVGRRDLVHHGLSYAFERIYQHIIDIMDMRTSDDENRDVFYGTTKTIDMVLGAKWACSRGHGRTYRRKYIDALKG